MKDYFEDFYKPNPYRRRAPFTEPRVPTERRDFKTRNPVENELNKNSERKPRHTNQNDYNQKKSRPRSSNIESGTTSSINGKRKPNQSYREQEQVKCHESLSQTTFRANKSSKSQNKEKRNSRTRSSCENRNENPKNGTPSRTRDYNNNTDFENEFFTPKKLTPEEMKIYEYKPGKAKEIGRPYQPGTKWEILSERSVVGIEEVYSILAEVGFNEDFFMQAVSLAIEELTSEYKQLEADIIARNERIEELRNKVGRSKEKLELTVKRINLAITLAKERYNNKNWFSKMFHCMKSWFVTDRWYYY